LNAHCEIPEDKLQPTVVVDAMLPLAEADLQLAGLLTRLEPFGTGNERPVFAAMNVEVLSLRLMGRKQNVCRLQLLQDGRPCEAITFRVEVLKEVISERYGMDVWERLSTGARAERGICLDLLYHLEINEFRGMTSAQCTICNIR
jgi:single-stranded-DNA-specific exonuclease